MGEAGIILNVDILSTLQEDPDGLEEWAHKNLVKLNKDKCKVLHLGKHNPGVQHRLGLTQLGSNSGLGALEVLVDTKISESHQCVESEHLCGRDPVGGWAASTGASPTDGRVIVPFHSAGVRPHLE